MAKHLSEDEVTLVVNAKADKAQQNIRKFSKEIDNLGERNKSLQRQMESLELAGKKNTDSWKQRREEYGRNATQIRNLKQQIAAETKALDLNALTMVQLRQQARSLQRQLDNTSKTINPEDWKKLSSRLSDVRERMGELSDASKSLVEKYTNPQTMAFFRGELFIRFAELGGKALQKVKEFAAEGISMAETADGIIRAFNKIGTEDYLQTLREATKGTVSDIELMKAAVKAKDFRIPLEDLGKYLSFAQLKAQQTGQSLDYMVDSIVTGLGRQSPQILDNLGLSAAEIKEQTKETGDFMKGVATIVEKNLAAAGETYISAADRAAQRTVDLENAQLSLGKSLVPIKEEFTDIYGQIQIGVINAITYIVKHRDTLMILVKAVGLLTATYLSYVAVQKIAYLWSLRAVAVSKLKAAAIAVEDAMLALSILRHAVLNKTMKTSIALQKAFNVVLRLSPWGLLLGGITLVVGSLLLFRKRTDDATASQQRLNQVEKQASESAAEETGKLRSLYEATQDQSIAMDKRKQMVEQLKQQYPDYFGKLTTEAILAGNAAEQYRILTAEIMAAAKARAYQDEITRLTKDSLEHERNANADRDWRGQNKGKYDTAKHQHQENTTYTHRMTSFAAGFTESGIVARGTERSKSPIIKEYEDRQKREKGHLDAIAKNEREIKSFAKKIAIITPTKTSAGNVKTVGTVGAQIDAITKKIDLLKAKRLDIKVGDTKGLKAIDSQIAELEQRKASLEYSSPQKSKKKKKKKKEHKKNPDDIASRKFSHDRQQDLEDAKRSYEEDLNALNEALAQKRLTQEQYNAYVSALNIEHQNNLLSIEQSYLTLSENLVIKDAAKKKAIKEQQNKAVADQQQAAYNAYIEAEKQYYDALEKIQETAPAKPQTLQEECDAKLLVLDGYYKAALQRAIEDGEKQKEVTEAYEKAKAAIVADYAKKIEEERARARQEYGLDTFTDQLAARRKKIDEDFAKGLLTQEQYNQAIANLEKQAEEQRLQIRQQYGLASQQELYNAELEQLKEHLRQGLISHEEYEEAVSALKRAKWKADFDNYRELFGGAVQELMKAEEANVDAKYDAEIEAARNAGKDTTDLEKKKANEKLKIQKKYADVNFAIQAAQIIASTASAIAKTFSELGFPAGIPAAALMGITGAAQLAAANAERQKVKRMSLNGAGGASSASGTRVVTGLESGGSIDVEREQDGKRFHADYDPYRRGFIDKPTVIVGEGGYGRSREWVASNAAVENPTVAPFLNIIDQAQRAGNIRTLDMNKFLLQQAQGRAAGGYITPSAPTSQPMPTVINHRDEYNKELLETLKELRNNGIRSYVALDDFDAQQKLRNQVRRIASK
ncbi:2-oxoacid:ferredoxin oxidoreductase subunit delta [Prevotella aurantiaca]|uniref:2-oxoacid:ferredoxin oxidoreductase subunit delta n=1 Tax=Prevotella aurantiaca TaxID=596085 RepID=UPI00288C3A29|nr:2-oxoacid:ferredoxin oxidoreductase subunit delta [Prevotella aurantiaca]